MQLSQNEIDDLIGFSVRMFPSPISQGGKSIFFGEKDGDYYILVLNRLDALSNNTFFYIRFSDRLIVGDCELSENVIQELNDWINVKKDLLIEFEKNVMNGHYEKNDSLLHLILQ